MAVRQTGIPEGAWVRTAEGRLPGWHLVEERANLNGEVHLRRYGFTEDRQGVHLILIATGMHEADYLQGPEARREIRWINLIRAL